VLKGNLAEGVAAVAARHHRGEIQVLGSRTLVQALARAELVDEYRLWTFPVVLGSGKRLFGATDDPVRLEHIAAQRTQPGVAIHTYRPIQAHSRPPRSPDP
jgi:dihydrofolate reductase